MDSDRPKRVIVIRLPTDAEMQAEIEELLRVRIPAAYKQALEKLSLLAGIEMKEAVAAGLKLFFEDFEKKRM